MEQTQDRQLLIAKLRRLPSQIDELVAPLTPEQLMTAVPSDPWTIAQHIHHIADSHMNCFIRVKLILTEDRPQLKPYIQDSWVVMADEKGLPVAASQLILRGLHQRWVTLWENLKETDWERAGIHPELGVVQLTDLLQSYAQHGEDHLGQIQAILTAQRGKPLSSR